ncbi:hypothetical protein DFQ05_1532 [Winogradskyella wandonensis]|uniref:Lipoprotein n=1 Tax=Winogradskyella wandonensis TaxID=1442586 RepID=A0A4V2PTT0_9FLAO|nr:hypothetical protein [Winogradskyella wandonensis]TCK67751.1 hypothetical protein DFQ05_1532 [Winogradskyella wandonensis]
MKKILLLFVLVSLFSCDIGGDDDLPNIDFQLMPIDSVEVPSEFTFGQVHQITVNYTQPNGCHEFNRFLVDPIGNTRIVAVVDTVYLDANCTEAIEEVSVSFNFNVLSLETYTFQFYQGKDENGEDQYLIIDVPVVE